MEKLLTVKQLAEYLQVSQALVYKWVHYDFIPYIKIGTLVRFRLAQVEKWLAKSEKRGRLKMKMEKHIKTTVGCIICLLILPIKPDSFGMMGC